MTIVLSLICLIIVIALYKDESRYIKGVSPILALGGPYTALLVLVAVYDISSNPNYSKVDVMVPVYSIYFLMIFWLVGKFISLFYDRRRVDIDDGSSQFISTNTNHNTVRSTPRYLNFISWVCLFISSIIFFNFVLNFRFSFSSSGEIRDMYSGGIIAHLVNINSALLLFIFSANNETKIVKIMHSIAIAWIAFLILAGAKYSILMYAVSLMIIYISSRNRKIPIRRIVVLGIIAAGLYFVTYAIRFIIQGYTLTTIPYEFIVNHFVYYLTGGYYAFSESIIQKVAPSPGVGVAVLFGPIVNVVNLLLGRDFNSTISNYLDIRVANGYSRTNVYTMFGVFRLEIGFWGATVSIALISILAYIIFYRYMSSKRKSSIPIFAYFCSTLIFSFFNCFYGTISVWEIGLVLLALDRLDRYRFTFGGNFK